MSSILDPTQELKRSRPQAGEERTWFGSSVLFLSPKPTPTNITPVDWKGSFTEINNTYLEVGATNQRKAFQVQIINLLLVFILFIFFIFPIGLLQLRIYTHPEWNQTLLIEIWKFIKMTSFFLIPIFMLFSIFCYSIIYYSSYKKTIMSPIFFNRQRREVCYIPSYTNRPIIQPWEEMIAWLGHQTNFSGQAILQHYTLGFVFEDKVNNQAFCAVLDAPATSLALSQWEAIYQYMEYGISGYSIATPPESRETLNQKRKQLHLDYKASRHGLIYVFFWYMWHILTLWKQPYWIAEWDQRNFGSPHIPSEVRDWLQSLPEEQWIKRSKEFIFYQKEHAKMLKQGKSFIDRFQNLYKK